jgi:hypothetical protein
MIIWQGLGFLAFLIPIATYVATFVLCGMVLGSNYPDAHAWPGAVGVLIGAVLIWLLAMKLNVPGRKLIDPATGQMVILKKKHTLFFIPMKYVAVVVAVIGVGLLFIKKS